MIFPLSLCSTRSIVGEENLFEYGIRDLSIPIMLGCARSMLFIRYVSHIEGIIVVVKISVASISTLFVMRVAEISLNYSDDEL